MHKSLLSSVKIKNLSFKKIFSILFMFAWTHCVFFVCITACFVLLCYIHPVTAVDNEFPSSHQPVFSLPVRCTNSLLHSNTYSVFGPSGLMSNSVPASPYGTLKGTKLRLLRSWQRLSTWLCVPRKACYWSGQNSFDKRTTVSLTCSDMCVLYIYTLYIIGHPGRFQKVSCWDLEKVCHNGLDLIKLHYGTLPKLIVLHIWRISQIPKLNN